jgi:hypothetical protein
MILKISTLYSLKNVFNMPDALLNSTKIYRNNQGREHGSSRFTPGKNMGRLDQGSGR